MPNWCSNTFSITGSKEEVDKFREKAFQNDGFTFQNLYPMPLDKERQLEESKDCFLRASTDPITFPNSPLSNVIYIPKLSWGNVSLDDAWYHWKLHNWGTKWDIEPDGVYNILDDDGECLILEFDTAWTPPLAFVKEVCKQFPELEFHLNYYELGNYFAGTATFGNGVELHSEEGDPADFEFCEDVLASFAEEDS